MHELPEAKRRAKFMVLMSTPNGVTQEFYLCTWIVWMPQAGTTLPDSPHQYQHLDVSNLVIGNKVASFTNLYQCLLYVFHTCHSRV